MDKVTIRRDGRVMLDGRATAWIVERGAYQGTTDDRLDRWYARNLDAGTIDRSGAGHATRMQAARAAVEQINTALDWT